MVRTLEWLGSRDKPMVRGPGFGRASENDIKTQECKNKCQRTMNSGPNQGSLMAFLCLKLSLASHLPYVSPQSPQPIFTAGWLDLNDRSL